MTELCARHGISRQARYHTVARYQRLQKTIQAPEGRKRFYATDPKCRSINPLIPYISRIVLHMILLQKRHKLLLKRPLLVMLFLPHDIFRHCHQARFAQAENTVTRLPCKSGQMFLPHPT